MATALVTGASAGIGEEFAYALARERYELVLVARREARLREVAEKARVLGSGKVLTIAADLSQRETPAAIHRQLVEQNVAVDYLVNNAGFGTRGRFSQLPLERELEEIDLNVGALVALTRLFAPAMIARRHGTIINVASTAGFQPLPYMANYAATKAYVISFSLAMAAELRRTGVTMLALCPGPTHSEFHAVAGTDFGVYLTFRNPRSWRRSIAEIYRDQLADAVLAEELGYGHVWTSEHHFRDDAWSPSLFPILGAIAGRTGRIRLGTYILILPFHNPVRVAEDAATIDIISNGRLDLGVGPGNFLSEYETFGVPRPERRPRMHEGLEIIRRAFTEDRFSFKGTYHAFPNVALSPKPIQQPHPPIWVAAIGEQAIKQAAQRGYHLAGGGPPQSQAIYDGALRAAGRDPSEYQIAQFRVMYLAETRDQAWDDAEQYVHYVMTSYDDEFKRAQDLLSQEFTTPPVSEPGALRKLPELTFNGATILVGTPADAIEDLQRYRSQARMTHIVLWMHLPGLDNRKARRSMELFAKQVMPHFRD